MHRRRPGSGSLTSRIAAASAIAAACSSGSATRSAEDAGTANSADDGAVAFDAVAMDALGGDAPSVASDSGEPDVLAAMPDAGNADAGACLHSPAGAGVCNSLTVSGSPVSVVCMSGQTLPQPGAGGTVANGQYVLTASTYFGACPSPETDRITWLICGSSWQTVQESTLNGMTTDAYLNAFVSTSGSRASIDLVCGQMTMATFGYDATPTTLTLYQPSAGNAAIGRVDTFTRQ
jgi:hypothetical protein